LRYEIWVMTIKLKRVDHEQRMNLQNELFTHDMSESILSVWKIILWIFFVCLKATCWVHEQIFFCMACLWYFDEFWLLRLNVMQAFFGWKLDEDAWKSFLKMNLNEFSTEFTLIVWKMLLVFTFLLGCVAIGIFRVISRVYWCKK
jgi:hypothetical protein